MAEKLEYLNSEEGHRSLLDDLKGARKVEAGHYLESAILEGELGYTDGQWIMTVEALIEANTIDTVELAGRILKGEFKNVAVHWFSHSDALRKILESLTYEPSFAHLSPLTANQICNAYKAVIGRLQYLSGAKDVCARFWVQLFQKPSFYMAKAVNSFDQLEYIGEADEDARLAFLSGLQMFLGKSEEAIFQDSRCWADLNAAISDALEIALDDTTDPVRFAEEAALLVRTCAAADTLSPRMKHPTPHGATAEKVVWSIGHNRSEEYKKKLANDCLENILEWAQQGSVESGDGDDSKSIPEGTSSLGVTCRNAVFEEIVELCPEILSIHGKSILGIYKGHRDEDRVIKGIVDIYGYIYEEVNGEFDLFFEDLFKYKGFPKYHYELLEKISRINANLYRSQHVSRLVARMGTHEEDIPYILDILISVADGNSAVMKGRGQDYYNIITGGQKEEEFQQSVAKINQLLFRIAVVDANEAERVVALMEDAYAKVTRLKTPASINNLLENWQWIAAKQPSPFEKRKQLINKWCDNPQTAENAKALKKTLGYNACGCNIL